jgi:hypothetical protein
MRDHMRQPVVSVRAVDRKPPTDDVVLSVVFGSVEAARSSLYLNANHETKIEKAFIGRH